MNKAHYNPEKLVELRERNKFTQEEVAEKLNVARNTVSRAELGVIASYDLLVSLSQLYGIAVTDLLYPYPEHQEKAA